MDSRTEEHRKILNTEGSTVLRHTMDSCTGFLEQQSVPNWSSVTINVRLEVAEETRILDIIGFSFSLLTIFTSIKIFHSFRALDNRRTRIHLSLFYAMMIKMVMHLIINVDQAYVSYKQQVDDNDQNVTALGINGNEYVCVSVYITLEYSTTAMFVWMFMEGYYLYQLLDTSIYQRNMSHMKSCIIAWGVPVILTALWANFTIWCYPDENINRCWIEHWSIYAFWIVQTPRLGVIICNLFFLFNILKVLIVKLRRSKNSIIHTMHKTTSAALVLFPLLGITNLLNIIEAPGGDTVYRIYSYISHFLISFQGFIIALIYCFFNKPVQEVLAKSYRDYLVMHPNTWLKRICLLNFITSAQEDIRNKRWRDPEALLELKPTNLRETFLEEQNDENKNEQQSNEEDEFQVKVEVQTADAELMNQENEKTEELKNNTLESKSRDLRIVEVVATIHSETN